MSYYNDVVVVFTFGSDSNKENMDFRTAGQMLPSGAIPVAVVNMNTWQYLEIINGHEPKDVIEWIDTQFVREEEDCGLKLENFTVVGS